MARVIRQIIVQRDGDIGDFDNLAATKVSGRNTNRQPASTADVLATDRKGDFFADGVHNYLYIVVDNAGTLEWRRITMGVW